MQFEEKVKDKRLSSLYSVKCLLSLLFKEMGVGFRNRKTNGLVENNSLVSKG